MNRTLYLVTIFSITHLLASAQDVKFHGIYTHLYEEGGASYLRFYPDGSVLSISSVAPREIVIDLLSYENRNKKNVTRGFYEIESKQINMPLLEQFDNKLFLKKGMINEDGTKIYLTSYNHDQGIVKKSRVATYEFSTLD